MQRSGPRTGHINGGTRRLLFSAFLLAGLSGCLSTATLEHEAPVVENRLDEARAATQALRAMLEAYYGGTEVLLESWLLGPGDDGFEAGVGFLADRFARKLVWQEPLVIGTIGSSVTAGYDNCHFDSYQEQLERLMAPVWAAAGVSFEVRNTGQGGDCGDRFDSQVWCLRALVGDDVDLTHYSWTYFEVGYRGVEAFHEMFYRWSLGLDRAPAPQLLYANDCSRFSPLDRELLELYAPFGANVLCMERGIRKLGYPGKQRGVIGDTLHDTTREGELLATDDPRRGSLGVVFRNWHPGPLLFQTTADALAYRYSAALLVALDAIEAEPEPRRRWPRQTAFDSETLPAPLVCRPEWCERRSPPDCLVLETPTFGETSVQRLAVDGQDNPHRDLLDLADAAWIEWQGPSPERYVPERERARPECAHPNRCAGLTIPARQQSEWLTFRLPDLELGFVAICCSKKKCGQRLLDAGPDLLIDGQMPKAAPVPLWNGKCLQVQERFEDPSAERPRTLHLGIRLPPLEKPPPAITHVIGS